MNHPVINFYLEKCHGAYNYSLQDMWNIPQIILGDGYFYIPWLFPVMESSKWNTKVPVFTEQEAQYFSQNVEIQQKYLHSVDFLLDYFCLYREGDQVYAKPELMERNYWLRNIGHESKKISRLIRSLNICGQKTLAKNLQQFALKMGAEKGVIQPETIGIWQSLIE
ncbi:hypothetical protein JFL47_02265 [Haemophilus haemoglobinophilus]|nr:hypothetical protein [Canicola haemoglobinophilus]MBN6710065.1 hypothetical protein [Canicola haemoglobinophilus]